jgi:hypothetical protein
MLRRGTAGLRRVAGWIECLGVLHIECDKLGERVRDDVPFGTDENDGVPGRPKTDRVGPRPLKVVGKHEIGLRIGHGWDCLLKLCTDGQQGLDVFQRPECKTLAVHIDSTTLDETVDAPKVDPEIAGKIESVTRLETSDLGL